VALDARSRADRPNLSAAGRGNINARASRRRCDANAIGYTARHVHAVAQR
jgi:hypothetical protein